MSIKTKQSEGVSAGKVVSFRVPDEDFAKLFNSALKATNTDNSKLALASVREGLASAVWKMSEGREEALEEFRRQNTPPSANQTGFNSAEEREFRARDRGERAAFARRDKKR